MSFSVLNTQQLRGKVKNNFKNEHRNSTVTTAAQATKIMAAAACPCCCGATVKRGRLTNIPPPVVARTYVIGVYSAAITTRPRARLENRLTGVHRLGPSLARYCFAAKYQQAAKNLSDTHTPTLHRQTGPPTD